LWEIASIAKFKKIVNKAITTLLVRKSGKTAYSITQSRLTRRPRKGRRLALPGNIPPMSK
jgi:hypothetical protein